AQQGPSPPMIASLALLLGAGAAGWLIPRQLRRVDLRRRDPLLMIVCCLLSMAGIALAAATGVVLLPLPLVAKEVPGHSPGRVVQREDRAGRRGPKPAVEPDRVVGGLRRRASIRRLADALSRRY